MLTLAVSKGRLLRETMPLLAAIGCAPLEAPGQSRALIVATENPQVRLLIVRARDALTYVACGAADAGFAGGDIVAENPNSNIYQPLTLNVGKCRLVAACRQDQPPPADGRALTVATKYVNLARAYFNRQAQHVHFVKLYGNLELAPRVGLADMIVDLADSGDTLRANGLQETAVIGRFSAVLITNRVATRRHPLLGDIQRRLGAALSA